MHFKIQEYPSLGSTNDLAIEQAEQGAEHGTVIIAEQMTAGRGRHGNQWIAPKGNLYLSLVLRPETSRQDCAQLAFVAAVAVADTLIEHGIKPQLKWPNDVLINDKKSCGILIEADDSGANTCDWIVIGIGINVSNAPQGKACLHDYDESITPSQIHAALLESFANHYDRWVKDGFQHTRTHWLKHVYGLDKPITVRLPKSQLSGVFSGIDADGALLLLQDDGTERVIRSGEVHFGEC